MKPTKLFLGYLITILFISTLNIVLTLYVILTYHLEWLVGIVFLHTTLMGLVIATIAQDDYQSVSWLPASLVPIALIALGYIMYLSIH